MSSTAKRGSGGSLGKRMREVSMVGSVLVPKHQLNAGHDVNRGVKQIIQRYQKLVQNATSLSRGHYDLQYP